jgi:CheY-like chemotaxis protein
MSHELRTPLNGIISISNLLLTEKYLPNQEEDLNMLKYSSDHMMDLVNDILDYSKIEADKLELEKTIFDLEALVNKLIIFFNQQATAKNLQLSAITNSVKNMLLIGDPMRLRQVLTNLISNAIKFTNSGTVQVYLKVITIYADNVDIEFKVKDTGIGIQNNKLDIIFNSFTQADIRTNRKYGGTGLGLTISSKLVALMGSSIKVESIHGKGSSFYFTLKLGLAKELEVPKEVKKDKFTSLLNYTILVAEDNKVNSLVLNRFLQSWNATVVSVDNGVKAIEEAKKNKFHVIFMDLEMPIMDGKKAALKIRDFDRVTPIVALTASTGDNLQQELLNTGFNFYLPKPFNPKDLHNCIISLTKTT